MKKKIIFLALLISAFSLNTANSSNVDSGEPETLSEEPFVLVPEMIEIEEAVEPPSNKLEKTVRTHQLKILNLLYEKNYQAVSNIVNQELSTLPQGTWRLFLKNYQNEGIQWTDLSYKKASEIAQPFNKTLNQEEIATEFKKASKNHFGEPGETILLELIVEDEDNPKKPINNFVTTLAHYTSDPLLFDIMKKHFSAGVPGQKAHKSISEEDIESLSKLLEKTDLSHDKVKKALKALESRPVFTSFDEWQPDDPHTELAGLLITTKKQLEKAVKGEATAQLEQLRTYWYNLSNLLKDVNYEPVFKETLKENFKKVDLPKNTPAHICLEFERAAQLTPAETKAHFDEFKRLSKEAKTDQEAQDELAEKFMGLYAQLLDHNIPLPGNLKDKEKVVKDLNGKKDAFLEQAEVFMTIVRQAYFCIRDPLALALYKALNESNTKFALVIAEYKKIAAELHITPDFAIECFAQCTNAKNGITDDVPELLENKAFELERTATPTTLQQLTDWLTTLWTTAEKTPSTKNDEKEDTATKE